MNHKKIVIECESDVFWIYDSDEKQLLLYTDNANNLAQWLEANMLENKNTFVKN